MMDDEREAAEAQEKGPLPAEAAAVQVPAAELERLTQRAALADDLREQMLRARADYANLQKRHDREAREFRRHILKDVLGALLPAVDDLYRAVDARSPEHHPVREGVRLALERLEKALRELGVERLAAVGRPFDPAIHEALAVETRPDVNQPIVVEESAAGYRTGDLVIRPARVKVAVPLEPKPPSASGAAPEQDSSEDPGG